MGCRVTCIFTVRRRQRPDWENGGPAITQIPWETRQLEQGITLVRKRVARMDAFNFREWLTEKCRQEPRVYKWDRAAKFVLAQIRSTGEQPFAAFHCEWAGGDYDQPDPHDIGYAVLFEECFWLVSPIWLDERQCVKFQARGISKLKILPFDDPNNWRMYNFSINDCWLRLSVWPARGGGHDAFTAFKRYL